MAKRPPLDPLIVSLRKAAKIRGAKPFHVVELTGMSYGNAWRLLNTTTPKPSWNAIKALALVAGMNLHAVDDSRAAPLRARRTRRG